MFKNTKYLALTVLLGVLGYIVGYFLLFSDIITMLINGAQASENLFLLIVFNIIIFLLFQSPSFLIYYHYKLKVNVLDTIKKSYVEGELIELKIQVSDESQFIFIDVDLDINWPGEMEYETYEKYFKVKLNTDNLVGLNNLKITANKRGYFGSSLLKELVIF